MAGITAGRTEWGALFLLTALKLTLLSAYGPVWEPDWLSYSAFADTILRDDTWVTDAGIDRGAAPLTLFRSIGYPLTVAGLRLAFGPGEFAHLVVVALQIALSLVATALVWRLAAAVLHSRWLALLAAFAHATGIGLLYDQSLLTDSLYASLFILGWTVPLIGLLREQPPKAIIVAGLGVALAYTCLLRGTGLAFLLALILPPLAWWTLRWRRAWMIAVFLAPVMAVIATIMAWNHGRVGEWTMTTGAQYVMIQPLVKAAARGADVFDGDTVLDQVARAHLRRYDYGEVMDIVDALFNERGIGAVQSARLHKELYVRTWLRHPGAMLRNTVANFDESVIFQLFNPLDNAFFYSRLVTGDRIFPGVSKAWARGVQGDFAMAILLVLVIAARLVSYLLLAALVAGVGILAVRRWRAWTPHEAVVLWLGAMFMAYTVSLCALHMAARFMPAVAAAGTIAALFLVRWAWKARRHG